MHDDKWRDIIARIQDDFTVLEHETKELPEEDAPGQVEYIIFEGPLGTMKLERTSKPLVLEEKTIGSRRIGSQTHVEKVYSDTEKVHTFKAYRQTGDTWIEMEMEAKGSFSL